MPNEIKDLQIIRVSLVKRPANRRRFLMLKHDVDTTGEQEEEDMSTMTPFEQKVTERVQTLAKAANANEATIVQLRAAAIVELAKEKPELYMQYRQDILRRSG